MFRLLSTLDHSFFRELTTLLVHEILIIKSAKGAQMYIIISGVVSVTEMNFRSIILSIISQRTMLITGVQNNR